MPGNRPGRSRGRAKTDDVYTSSDDDGGGARDTPQEVAQRSVLEALRAAGAGNVNRDDMVTREGTRYTIPAKATLREASKFLRTLAEQQEEDHAWARNFPYRPWDGAVCAYRAMRETFGAVADAGKFPQTITIPSGPGETIQVPWGEFSLPGLNGCTITFGATGDRDKGVLFAVTVYGPKKYASEIEGLFNLIESACATYSIYKGKAFDGQEMPEFLRIDIDPAKVVYTGDVEVQLRANVWSVIEDADLQRAAGLPLKRSVLLHGPYGTGKSLFLGLTAKKATEHGWTYIRCRPGVDTFESVLSTAALYAPAVVAFEDVDTLASSESSATDVARLLDAFDGVTSKGKEIIALLTTNHPERIHKGMVRPGRLDAVIRIDALDREAIGRLVSQLVPAEMLAPDVDLGAVATAMDGYMPAFIKEATDRAIRYAISRGKGSGPYAQRIDTEDLVNAAHGLRDQLALMSAAEDHTGFQPTLDRTIRRIVGEAIHASGGASVEHSRDAGERAAAQGEDA